MVTIRLGARLRAARKAAGFKTSKEFLKKYKVPASTYSQHESGARVPNDESLEFYGRVFGVTYKWLKTGKGQPYKQISVGKKEIMNEELIDLNKGEIKQKILTSILEKLLKIHVPQLSTTFVKSISKKAAITYINTITSVYSGEK